MELTKQQKDYLPAIMWLVDDTTFSRATGRTTLLAIVFLEKAIKNSPLGLTVEIFDHERHPRMVDYLIRRIHDIYGENYAEEWILEYNTARQTIKMKSRK